ncbi:hypothetical protein [Hansschlegelia plantiphila]|uniref:Uncharacterized protein n=1 Tax=Hansschlegelia plantiphila TaxID=374655 RepID=A0A9W6J4R5_9HYPH|nr:hypothetical protein [Hansschlegelia plantiphila]GLK69200.1 hypothetical protein GCM10008179_28380 [Hansschlegelia plantiphila]
MGDLHPVDQAQIDASQAKVTLDEMLDLARGEAARIAIVQRGLIDAGLRKAPDAGQIRIMVVHEATATLIETVGRRGFGHAR